jgi:hypothetical protein
MTMNLRIRPSERDGAVMVMVAFLLPVMILMLSFVADIGNWFEHKRHLQIQADAAALAAAGDYNLACSDPLITATANDYGLTRNPQVGGTPPADVHLLINSETWWNQTAPTDSDFAGGSNSSPCASGMIDVKMTENDLPWFMRVATVPFINAQARVEIRKLTTQRGALPIAVPDPDPKSGAVIFVNDADGSVIAAKRLVKRGTTTLNGRSLTQWDNVGDAASVSVPTSLVGAPTGVREVIALSGLDNMSISGTLAEICTGQLVACYGSATGLTFIHGYSGTGGTPTPAAPVVRDAKLESAGCSDGSAPYFLLNRNCNAKIKFRVCFDLTCGNVAGTALVAASAPICPNGGNPKGCPLVYQTTGADAGYWTATVNVPTSTIGSITFGINWKVGSGSSATSGSVANLQRLFGADLDDAVSGPIQFATVGEDTGVGISVLSNSLRYDSGNPHNLVGAIGVLGNLQDASDVNDPVVVLRVVGSQNQSVDCDPIADATGGIPNLRDELANGCKPTYTVNTGQACPSTGPSLWSTDQPWNCVALQTGGSVGQAVQGMDDRILAGGTCADHPNNWALFPDLPAGDTRIVPVFLTPFGTFQGSGNEVVPIQNFAHFYVTGWGHNGNGNGCTGDDKMPDGSDIPPGFIVGHFIKYVQTLNTGGGDEMCDLTGFGSCVAVLTR